MNSQVICVLNFNNCFPNLICVAAIAIYYQKMFEVETKTVLCYILTVKHVFDIICYLYVSLWLNNCLSPIVLDRTNAIKNMLGMSVFSFCFPNNGSVNGRYSGRMMKEIDF